MIYPNTAFQSEPARVKDLVKRKRLEPLGQRMLEYQVTTVVAPAGYGKTVWVSSLLEIPGWPASVWISLDRQDSEPPILLYHLFRSLSRIYQNPDALRTLMSLENFEKEWSIAAEAFLDALPHDHQLMLILDDVDFLYDNQIAVAIIEFILARLPYNIHIVFIARNTPPFKLYRQEIKNQLYRIGSRELLFLEDEARVLFANMKLGLSDSDVVALYARTEGWAVGLRLLGMYLQQPGSSLEEALQSLQQENSSSYIYIMNEFLAAMPSSLRDFLVDASILPYLEIKLCYAALECTDSERMLGILSGYGVISPLKDKGIWRMHHLFENWLQDIAAKQRGPGYLNEIRERAAVFFEQSGDINRAVEQSMLSARWDRAAQLIHEHGSEYVNSGFRMDILYKWIEKLPEKLVESDCWLLYFKGMSILNVDDPRAFQILSSAADLAVRTRDIKCEAGAIWSMLLPAIFSGDVEKSEIAGRRLMSNPELMTNPLSRKEALAAALQYAMARDSLLEGIEISRQVLKLELPPELSIWVRYTVGYLLLRLGRLQEARQIIEQTLTMPYVSENERRLIVGYEALMDITFIMGDFKALDEACRLCLELGKKYGMLGIMGRVYYLQAHCHYREGSYSEARRDFDAAYEYFTSAGIVHFANQTAIDILLLRISNGENAEELLARFLELKSLFDSIPYGLGIDYMITSSGGTIAMEAGQFELAGQLLEISARRWREIGSKLSLTGTNLLMAYLMLLRGKEKSCDNLLRKALGAAEASQWVNFWEWHQETIYTMCWRAIYQNIHPHWAANILRRWFPKQSRQKLSLLLISPNDELQALAADFFQQSFQSTGKVVFSVFYLGGFRLFINGLEIEESNWKTQKAEDLLKYIIADRRMSNKEYLIQQLWPDGDPESNDGKLRMTLSYVRKALASAGLSPESVVMHRGVISLDADFEIHCDYRTFIEEARNALRYAGTNRPLAIQSLEQAIGIYTGEFLPEDIYEDLTMGLRSTLHNLYLEAMAELAQLQFSRNNFPAALLTCNHYLAQEPVEETIIRMAMSILLRMNKKYKAIELYRKFEATLLQDYNTTPEQETAALFQRIQGGFKQ